MGVYETVVSPLPKSLGVCGCSAKSGVLQIGQHLSWALRSRRVVTGWIGATHDTADTSIVDYFEVVDRAVAHCGGRVNLIGDCQGGWLAAIYAALHPERANTLTPAGAPIDFHAGESVIHEVLRHLTHPRRRPLPSTRRSS
jgi:pimeloyl-ACP methyl ester carboxylesterase